jgi:hypothetical protein
LEFTGKSVAIGRYRNDAQRIAFANRYLSLRFHALHSINHRSATHRTWTPENLQKSRSLDAMRAPLASMHASQRSTNDAHRIATLQTCTAHKTHKARPSIERRTRLVRIDRGSAASNCSRLQSNNLSSDFLAS